MRSSRGVFFSKHRIDEKAAVVWRRFLETTQRQEITPKELVDHWGCQEKDMSYSEFMRGLVAVLGPASTQFAHSERKRLFESLRPNRDGLVNVDVLTRNIMAVQATMTESFEDDSDDDSTILVVQPPPKVSCLRDLRLRYRRERLLSANLAFRTALLDQRPVLCLRVTDEATKVVAETSVVVQNVDINGTIVWDSMMSNGRIGSELATALLAPFHGVCGTILSLGDDAFIFGEDGLLKAALHELLDESFRHGSPDHISLEVAIVANENDEPDWIPVHHSEDLHLGAKEGGIARIRVHDQKFGPCGELRLASVQSTQVIDIDDVDAWFSPGGSTGTKLSSAAGRWAPQTFVYAVIHVDKLTRKVAADLGRRSRQQVQLQDHRALESFLPLELLRTRRAQGHAEKSNKRQEEEEDGPSIVDLIGEASRRIDDLEKRRKQLRQEGFLTNVTTTDESLEIGALERSCKKQRLLAWDRGSRLQAALGRVQVVCRIRPLLRADSARGPPPEVKQRLKNPACVTFVKRGGKGRHIAVNCEGHKLATSSRLFEFDDVWDELTSQEEVFESVENLTNDALCGRTASVFAYGCTGGGKSYTVVGDLLGEKPRLGIAFQSVELLLATLKSNKSVDGRDASILLSMVEVHNEEVYDLLKSDDALRCKSPSPSPSYCGVTTPPRSSGGGGGGQIFSIDETNDSEDASSIASYQASDSQLYYHPSSYQHRRRSPGGSGICSPSSSYAESESSFTTTPGKKSRLRSKNDKTKLEIRLQPGGKAQVADLTKVRIDDMKVFLDVFRAGNRRRATTATLLNEHSSRSHVVVFVETSNGGRLCLVDLAGCERVAKSGASGPALKEATCINKSLSALGDCFQAMDQKRTHIPYRNSKLTYLLSDVIGGSSSRCLFVFCCSPAWKTVPETLSCFKFAARMSTIQLDGDLLTDKQKQIDAIFSSAADRRERKLLSTFLTELKLEEADVLKFVNQDAQRLLQHHLVLDDDDLLPLEEEEDPPLAEVSELSDARSSSVTTDDDTVDRRRIDRDLEHLWRRLRATEAEIATLREAAAAAAAKEEAETVEEEDLLLLDDDDDEDDEPPPPPPPPPPRRTSYPSTPATMRSEDMQHFEERTFDSDDRVGRFGHHEIIDIDEMSDDDIQREAPKAEPPIHPTPVVAFYDGDFPRTKDITIDIIDDQDVPEGPGCGVGSSFFVFCKDSGVAENPRRHSGRTTGRKLVLHLRRAEGLLKDTSFFGGSPTLHPYAVCKYGDDELRTSTIADTYSPIWNADLVFSYDSTIPDNVTIYFFSANTYTPDCLMGKCVVNFKRPPDNSDNSSSKPNLLLPTSWLPIQPCVEHERYLLRHFDHDKAFGIHFRPPRYVSSFFSLTPFLPCSFLFKKGSLGMLEVAAYSFTIEDKFV